MVRLSFLGRQTVLGASAYLHMINDEGGVYGRKIQLQAFDDSYDPDKAPACFKRMTKEGVFALGFFVGTPTAKVYVPLAQEDKIPVVGLFTGAQLLYEPLKHEVINVRASYYDETREQVDKLWEQNIRKIGVIYQDDPFGKTVLDGVKLALQKHNAAPVATGHFDRGSVEIESGLREVMAVRPQAVVIVGPYGAAAAIVKQAHAAGWRPQFLTVSFVGTEKFISEAGADADGTIITQVMPPYDRTDYPTVALYRQCLAKYSPGEAPSFVSFEGFVDAMVVIEGLKRGRKRCDARKVHHGDRVHPRSEYWPGAASGPQLQRDRPQGIRQRLSDHRKGRTSSAADGLVLDRQVEKSSRACAARQPHLSPHVCRNTEPRKKFCCL